MKEKAITAILGITIGIVIAASIFFGPTIISKLRTSKTPTSPTPLITPAPVPVANLPVTISSLIDGQIVTDKTVEVSGKTSPQTTVSVTDAADEQVVKSDSDGNFKTNLKIDEGENTIIAAITDARGTLQVDKKQIILEISE